MSDNLDKMVNDFVELGEKTIAGVWPPPQRSGYGVLGASAKPPAVAVEYGLKNYSEDAPPYAYDNEGAALRALTHQRKELARFGVPEEFWPILLKRSVEIVTGSWEHMNE